MSAVIFIAKNEFILTHSAPGRWLLWGHQNVPRSPVMNRLGAIFQTDSLFELGTRRSEMPNRLCHQAASISPEILAEGNNEDYRYKRRNRRSNPQHNESNELVGRLPEPETPNALLIFPRMRHLSFRNTRSMKWLPSIKSLIW